MDLKRIYTTPSQPGSFQGPQKLYSSAKGSGISNVRQKDVEEYLQSVNTYTLNRTLTRKFRRNRVVVEGIDSQWDVDLADMRLLYKDNDGYKYFMLAVDVFTRYVWVRLLKSKHATIIGQCLESILKEGRVPKTIRTDGGREFQNGHVNRYLKDRSIHLFSTYNETQANYAERVIKTIKSKLYRYLLDRNTLRYADVLLELVESYNHTKHSSLGCTPASINRNNESEARLDQYLLRRRPRTKEKYKQRMWFNVGDQNFLPTRSFWSRIRPEMVGWSVLHNWEAEAQRGSDLQIKRLEWRRYIRDVL